MGWQDRYMTNEEIKRQDRIAVLRSELFSMPLSAFMASDLPTLSRFFGLSHLIYKPSDRDLDILEQCVREYKARQRPEHRKTR